MASVIDEERLMPSSITIPRLFIGSSTEALEVARTLEELLSKDANVDLWPHVFALGEMPLEALLKELDKCQYAVLVISDDDVILSRHAEQPGPRDNVIFEAGLFMGRFGAKSVNRSYHPI
jgi:predicted nucleotide-binding protein